MKMMKMTIIAIACVLALGLTATNARADIFLSPASLNPPLILIGPGSILPPTSTPNILEYIRTLGYDVSRGTELYKKDVGSPDSGLFATSYTTTFNSSASAGTIRWDGFPDPYISANPTYLLVKDGNHTPIWYLFNVGGIWDGRDTIHLTGFWPGPGAISHVAIYGTTSVPDGGVTLMLLGGVLVGLEGLRRRFSA